MQKVHSAARLVIYRCILNFQERVRWYIGRPMGGALGGIDLLVKTAGMFGSKQVFVAEATGMQGVEYASGIIATASETCCRLASGLQLQVLRFELLVKDRSSNLQSDTLVKGQ